MSNPLFASPVAPCSRRAKWVHKRGLGGSASGGRGPRPLRQCCNQSAYRCRIVLSEVHDRCTQHIILALMLPTYEQVVVDRDGEQHVGIECVLAFQSIFLLQCALYLSLNRSSPE